MAADPARLDDVRAVLEQNKEAIMRDYQAVGIGIGKMKPADQTYVITVFLKTVETQPPGQVAVEGVPLKFEVTGEITTQS